MPIELVRAEGKLIKKYIDFPHDLYVDDPMYVPELFMAQKDLFNRKKNPFYKNAEVEHFLAYRDGNIVGRITAFDNKRYNKIHNSNVGFFGFFDVINDAEVCQALMDKATSWCKERKFDSIMGPFNYSLNDTAGLLIDGFQEPPKIMMTYNKPYYKDLIEDYGFEKDMDLFAYILYTEKASEKSIRLAQALEKRLKTQGITIRNINMKNFDKEVAGLMDAYNSAWKDNWGAIPMTKEEILLLGSELKMIANKKWIYIAEDKGKVVGFGITLNNINEITINFKRGRLFPFNIFKLLRGRHKTKYVRIMALGVLDEYRKKGIEAILFSKNILQAKADNVIAGEVSWVLENNVEMVRSAEKLNSELYKTYRIYRRDI
ncbi:MAG: hypothetical protein V3V00_04035 [Saprospiraceae bacterium]